MNLQNQINYLREYLQQDMFDECSVPTGLDMQRVRGAIVMRCGLLTPLFSEPEVQRAATQQFFYENQWNFNHVLKIIEAEYSPIENVAEWRTEQTDNRGNESLTVTRDSTETHSGVDEREIKESGTTATAGTDSKTAQESGTTATAGTDGRTTTESGSTTTTNEISAENASAYQPDNKSTVQHGKGETVSGQTSETVTHGKGETVSGQTSETVTHGKGVNDDLKHGEIINNTALDEHTTARDGSTAHTMSRHGNIGVTTNQDLISQELDLLERFNPYKFIAELYERQLIIGLY